MLRQRADLPTPSGGTPAPSLPFVATTDPQFFIYPNSILAFVFTNRI
jgi:hypothetical protein